MIMNITTNQPVVQYLGQQLQIVSPTGVGEGDRGALARLGEGVGDKAAAGLQAALLQGEGIQLTGQILGHARLVELQGLETVPGSRPRSRGGDKRERSVTEQGR